MAIHPTDFNRGIMYAEHGTVALITSPMADKYLNKAKENRYKIPADRYSRWCGGENGFDDFCEWM